MSKQVAIAGLIFLIFLISSCRQNKVASAKNAGAPSVAVRQPTVPKETVVEVQQPAAETQQTEADPNRPACLTVSCRNVKKFLKDHYCGESPFGNGPDDGCAYKEPIRTGAKLAVSYLCDWDETSAKSVCHQIGQPSVDQRNLLLRELRRTGLPPHGDEEVTYTIVESHSGWTLMSASYDHIDGPTLDVCGVVLAVDEAGNLHVLRSVKLQRTNSDAPNLTFWSPLDIADVDGDGQVEFVLKTDAYEDHWLEVVKVQDDSAQTIFSGLGYYL